MANDRTHERNSHAMNIIIIGSGTVGAAICSQLAEAGHDITVIDNDTATLNEISNNYDVTAMLGNGADIDLLKEAGAEDADILLAVTTMDEINMLCCFAAKKLGTKHTIARVRNPEYTSFMQLMKDDINLSMTINPEYAAAKEISNILRFPSADRIDTFCSGKVELAEFTVNSDSPLCNSSLYDLRGRFNCNFLICGVCRGDNVYIPGGNFVIQAGDTVCVTASEEELIKFFKLFGAYRRPVKKVLIHGGGRTTYYLANLLGRRFNDATVIEKDLEKCRELTENHKVSVINGDGTNQALLLEEGIESADAFLALSESDEENAIVSMYAKKIGVPRIITMIKSLPYIDFFSDVGLDSIVSPRSSTVDYILKFVRGLANVKDSELESLHTVMDGRIEAIEFIIKDNIEGLTNVPLVNIRRNKNVLVACIARGNDIIIPQGRDELRAGDRVIVLTTDTKLNSIKDILN